MRQFIVGSKAAFTALEARARHACVRFADHEMPPGATPLRASVGFEVDAQSGEARLLVDRGITYSGADDDVRQWFAAGEKTFEDFENLRAWITSTLQAAFCPPASPAAAADLPVAEVVQSDLPAVGTDVSDLNDSNGRTAQEPTA